MRKFLLFTVAAVCVSCASPRIVYVPVVHDSIQIRTVVRVDSVWRDRVRVERIAGDTVRILDSVIVREFQNREIHDTLRIHDSIPVVREVPGPVEYRRSGYDRFCSWFFWIVVALTIIVTAWKIFKRVYLHM